MVSGTYLCHDSGRHGKSRASRAGDSRWMEALTNWRTVGTCVFCWRVVVRGEKGGRTGRDIRGGIYPLAPLNENGEESNRGSVISPRLRGSQPGNPVRVCDCLIREVSLPKRTPWCL
jgi:hypothetical protein